MEPSGLWAGVVCHLQGWHVAWTALPSTRSQRGLRSIVVGSSSAAMGAFQEVPATESPASCGILVGPAAILAQLALLVIVITALLLKRHGERPRRAWNVWLLDVSKQACSAGMGHVCGMLIAVVAHRSAAGVSECGWYLVVYLMDCTLGITLAILFHHSLHRVVRWQHARLQAAREREDDRGLDHPWTEALLESGNYGDPPNMRRWAIQAAGWVTCVVSARLTVGAVVLLGLNLLAEAARALDRAFIGQPHLELFTVMVGIPMTLNVGQAWIQDQVLKWKARRHIKRGGLESVGSGPSCHPADPGAPVPGPGGGGTGGGAGDASAVREAQSRNRAAATANASEKTPLLG